MSTAISFADAVAIILTTSGLPATGPFDSSSMGDKAAREHATDNGITLAEDAEWMVYEIASGDAYIGTVYVAYERATSELCARPCVYTLA